MADNDAKNQKDAEAVAPVEGVAMEGAEEQVVAEAKETVTKADEAKETESEADSANTPKADETKETKAKTNKAKEDTTKADEAKEADTKADESKETETSESADSAEEKAPETYAKAGKKSKKHIEEVKAEEARQARKQERAAMEAAGEKPKGAAPITRPRIERRGKKYQEVAKLVEKKKLYSLKDAIELAIKSSPVKFDASVEIHVRLGVDPRQADQNIRTTMVLPNGNGKEVRVAVFAPIDACKVAKAAGADIAEDEEFIKQLEKGNIDFDVLIATPQYMPKLGKFARLLGPKGLMPNPKAGTVTNDVEKAVKEAKAGKIEYRVDKQAIVHIGVGKVSFGTEKLLENTNAFLDSLKSQKPNSLKGSYVKSVFITTTMGPSIQVENIYN